MVFHAVDLFLFKAYMHTPSLQDTPGVHLCLDFCGDRLFDMTLNSLYRLKPLPFFYFEPQAFPCRKLCKKPCSSTIIGGRVLDLLDALGFKNKVPMDQHNGWHQCKG